LALSAAEDHISSCISYYRGVYLLNENSNVAFGKVFIPWMKLVVLLGMIVTSFAIIRLRADLDAISSFLMPAALIGSLTLIVPITMVMSSTCRISEKFRQSLTSDRYHLDELRLRARNRNYFDRLLRSCSLIRCKVGNMYHMEAQAKLTMLDRTVNGLVYLLVNSKG